MLVSFRFIVPRDIIPKDTRSSKKNELHFNKLEFVFSTSLILLEFPEYPPACWWDEWDRKAKKTIKVLLR
jgi:hypothetical protein